MYRRVEGAANYRRVPLVVGEQDEDHSIYGTGMPSAPGYVCLFETGLTRQFTQRLAEDGCGAGWEEPRHVDFVERRTCTCEHILHNLTELTKLVRPIQTTRTAFTGQAPK